MTRAIPDQTDAGLAARLMARDERALREVIRLYGPSVNGMARRVIVDPTLAEEVAQDAFVALWRRPGAFDPARGRLESFLCGIARNKAIDLVRREEALKRTRVALMTDMESLVEEADLEDRAGVRTDVSAALKQLSPVQREAIGLAFYGGRTYRAVARELGVPEGTVKTRMRDGMIKLRSLLKEREEVGDE